MLLVLLTGIAAAAAALVLYLRLERAGRRALPLALLRAVAWGAVAALLVNPSCSAGRRGAAIVLLDGSRSMTDPGGDARWRAALDTARAVAGSSGRIVVFGEEPQALGNGHGPDGRRSRLVPALREAAAVGGAIVVVSDGEIDDAAQIPGDLLSRARVVLMPRSAGRDAGVASLDLPATIRAGDTAAAGVEIRASGAERGDSVAVELLEEGRTVARARVALGDGAARVELRFVPAPVRGERVVRRYEARLSGYRGDVEPRDDIHATVASVSRGSAIVVVSDSPDWDYRWLVTALRGTSGVPVRAFVQLSGAEGSWREAGSLRAVSEAAVREEISRAALVVAHGTAEGIERARRSARRALWAWPVAGVGEVIGDWYVVSPEFASPVGGALAGVPVESLPPLESITEPQLDSVDWTGLTAQLERRGRSRSVVQGVDLRGRRAVLMSATGLWRWASRGGTAAEAYRALVAATTDWLLEEQAGGRSELAVARDSLAREVQEYLPRTPALQPQPGVAEAGAAEPVPLRHRPWVFFLALVALVAEWIARRRRGLR